MNEFLSLSKPISLEELNSGSALLERFEQKYIVPKSVVFGMWEELNKHFYILEHVGKRIFHYESVYFDDNYKSFRQHQQGKRKRFKIRTRHYKDSDLCYLEIKVKTVRHCTDKRRIHYPMSERFHLNEEAGDFIRRIREESYGDCVSLDLTPVLEVANDRITLVSKKGGERMTIDLNLNVVATNGSWEMPADVVIIETKSKKPRGVSDAIMRQHHIRPVEYCSKYCIALAKTGQVSHYNQFRPVLRDIRRVSDMKGMPQGASDAIFPSFPSENSFQAQMTHGYMHREHERPVSVES